MHSILPFGTNNKSRDYRYFIWNFSFFMYLIEKETLMDSYLTVHQ